MTRNSCPQDELIETLTEKQSEMIALLAEGLTGKEIAGHLDISYSAASQRIQTLRQKFGGITKNEVARLYREYQAKQADAACTKNTGTKNHLHELALAEEKGTGNQPLRELEFSDSYATNAAAPWSTRRETCLVPEVLDGENAVLARWVYVLGIAMGMVIFLLILLAVSTSIGALA